MEYFSDKDFMKKIELIDSIRDELTLNAISVDLPQIIVVGDQSSGKSSIIEAISGIKLPRGVTTTTICPLIIQMKKSDSKHLSILFQNKLIQEGWDIKTENIISDIQKNKLSNKITNEPITLRKESPEMQNLTLIDLPGMVKTKSDYHDKNIIKDTQMMAEYYMKQKNSIILCVLSGVVDINSTQTIQLARENNEDLSRIIGVLTRIDRVEEKEVNEKEKILLNENVKLEKGYVGVDVSDDYLQADNNGRQRMEDKLREKFTKATRNIGIQRLIEKLKVELNTIIDRNFPELERFIKESISECQHKLSNASDMHDNELAQKRFLIDLRDKAVSHFDDRLVLGTAEMSDLAGAIKEIFTTIKLDKELNKDLDGKCTFTYCWSIIYDHYAEKLHRIFKEKFKLTGGEFYEPKKIELMMKQRRTENIALFFNSQSFKSIIISIVSEIHKETNSIIEFFDKIVKVIIQSYFKKSKEYKNLHENMQNTCLSNYNTVSKEAKDKITFIFDLEKNPFMPDRRFEVFGKEYEKTKKPKVSTPNVPNVVQTSGDVQRDNNPTSVTSNISRNIPNLNQNNSITPSNSSDNISLPIVSSKGGNSDARKVKAFMEFYITDMINRLIVLIPNVVQVTLFRGYKKIIEDKLADFISNKNAYDYFKLDAAEEEYIAKIKSQKKSFETCLKYIEIFQNSYNN